MELWELYQKGIMPTHGGWLQQPLRLLSQISAVDLVITTQTFIKDPKADYNALSQTQRELIEWLENDSEN